eukprot:g69866.t1
MVGLAACAAVLFFSRRQAIAQRGVAMESNDPIMELAAVHVGETEETATLAAEAAQLPRALSAEELKMWKNKAIVNRINSSDFETSDSAV